MALKLNIKTIVCHQELSTIAVMSSSQENDYSQRQICHRSLHRAPLNQDLQSPGIIVTFINICNRSARGAGFFEKLTE